MRINQNILVNNLLSNFRKNLERLNKLQNQLSTGKEIQLSSEDPLRMHRSLFLKSTILQDDIFIKNLGDAYNLMSMSEKALSDIGDILKQAKTIAIQGANDSSADSRMALSFSVENLIKSLINIANQHYDGKYIFSGDKTDTSPYAGNSAYQYRGDNSKRYTNIGLGFIIDTNLTGDEIFGTQHHKIISKQKVTSKDISLNKALGVNLSQLQSSFSFSVGDLQPEIINYIDPNFDSIENLANAISSKRLLVSNSNLNTLSPDFNRGTTSLSTLGFTPGQLIINGTTIVFGVDTNNDGVGDTLNNYTLDTLIREINSKVANVNAYYRSSDGRVIIASKDLENQIVVTDAAGGNFGEVSGLSGTQDRRTNSHITASVTRDGNLVLTSNISNNEGKMRLTDSANNGLLYALGISDENSVIHGKDYGHEQIFYTLEKLKDALRSVATKNDNLYDLQDAKKNSLGLVAGDIITFTAQTTSALQQLQLSVGNDVRTLNDLARRIQNFLRTNPNLLAETAIVRVVDGALQIINESGETSQTIQNISLTATSSDGTTQRTVFNDAMLTIAGTLPNNGSSIFSYQLYTTRPSENISSLLPSIDNLSNRNLSLQAEIGTKIRRVEMTKNRLEEARLNFTKLLSENEDADIAKAILEFQKQQTIYQSALGIGARIIQITLLDFLK